MLPHDRQCSAPRGHTVCHALVQLGLPPGRASAAGIKTFPSLPFPWLSFSLAQVLLGGPLPPCQCAVPVPMLCNTCIADAHESTDCRVAQHHTAHPHVSYRQPECCSSLSVLTRGSYLPPAALATCLPVCAQSVSCSANSTQACCHELTKVRGSTSALLAAAVHRALSAACTPSPSSMTRIDWHAASLLLSSSPTCKAPSILSGVLLLTSFLPAG